MVRNAALDHVAPAEIGRVVILEDHDVALILESLYG